MYYSRKLITYLVANLAVLYIAYIYAGNFIVFGRLEIGPIQALVTLACGLTLAAMLVDLLLRDMNYHIQSEGYLTLELMVNIGTLYLLARTPLQSSVGVGIVAFWVAIVLGFGLSIAQYIVKNLTDKAQK